MDVYMYQAALYCQECIDHIKQSLNKPDYEPPYDSDDYPSGLYYDGGGEADSPQHCGSCGLFLENPLTEDGINYVIELHQDQPTNITSLWMEFYELEIEEIKE